MLNDTIRFESHLQGPMLQKRPILRQIKQWYFAIGAGPPARYTPHLISLTDLEDGAGP